MLGHVLERELPQPAAVVLLAFRGIAEDLQRPVQPAHSFRRPWVRVDVRVVRLREPAVGRENHAGFGVRGDLEYLVMVELGGHLTEPLWPLPNRKSTDYTSRFSRN